MKLQPFPGLTHPAGITLQASVTRQPDGALLISYQLQGPLTALKLPAPQPAAGARDGLWQHSCFEAFIAGVGDTYHEFNFAPSGEWAAYAFDAYRERSTGWCAPLPVVIQSELCPDQLIVSAHLAAELVPKADALHIGLTAVLEAADGSLSYWALHHAGERPDFHLRESFVLTL